MKKFWKALTTLLFGVLLLSACAFIEPMYGRGDIYPVAFNHWSNGECYWVPGGGLNRIHCPRVRPLGALFWWTMGPSYNRYNRYDYYRPYYDYRPQRVPPVHYDTPPKQEDHGVVTKDGYKKVPPPAPERKAKPRTGGRGQGPSDHYFEGTTFDESVPLRERMPWLWPSCDPNCGRPSQELEFRLKEFEQFQSRELERFEQFKRNERIRYIHTPIMEE
jgi:hypothetical protein